LEFIEQALAAEDRSSHPKCDNFGGALAARATLAWKSPWRSSISLRAGACCFSRIIDGEIGCRGVEIDKLTEQGIRVADETEIHASVLILEICFRAMHEAIFQTVSQEIGDGDGRPSVGNK
jgi:hypothetical protein